MLRVAINGFGRIGRQVYKAILDSNFLNGTVEIVAVNDLVPADNIAYLLKYDTVHGRTNMDIRADEDMVHVGPHSFKVLALKAKPEELPWNEYNIDIVIESTGLWTKKDDAHGHIRAGAKKVIISAPSDADVKTIVMWVNHDEYNGEEIVSNASCTTNCLAPVVKVLLDSGIGIEEGLMTTCHAYTGTQPLVDGPSKKAFRDGRAGAMNIIPASTGAAKMVWLVLPAVKWKISWMALRVPTADVSVVDLTFKTSKKTSLIEIHEAMKLASEWSMKGILGYTEEPLVSSDFIHDSRSSIYDANACMELNDQFFKIITWYDNEWGYSSRMVDLLRLVAGKM